MAPLCNPRFPSERLPAWTTATVTIPLLTRNAGDVLPRDSRTRGGASNGYSRYCLALFFPGRGDPFKAVLVVLRLGAVMDVEVEVRATTKARCREGARLRPSANKRELRAAGDQ